MTVLAILAAGLGTRFSNSGGSKQLEQLGPSGELLIDYSIHDALRAGFDRVALIIRAEHERSFDELVSRWSPRASIHLVHQAPREGATKKVWGTAHAVLSLANVVKDRFAIINGDDFYGRSAFGLIGRHCRSTTTDEHAVAGFPVVSTLRNRNSVSRAILRYDDDELLTAVEEARVTPRNERIFAAKMSEGAEYSIPPDTLVSMNMWAFTPAIFEPLASEFAAFSEDKRNDNREFLLPQLIGDLVSTNRCRVKVLHANGSPMGITFAEDRSAVRSMLEAEVNAGRYPSPVWG